MAEPWGRWSPSRSDAGRASPELQLSHGSSRPSGKAIYAQRRDYAQSLLQQDTFQHHVEHLLTVRLERDVRSVQDCVARLKALDAQGRLWGQGLVLHVQEQALVLSDAESKEELERFPLGAVQECSAPGDAEDALLALRVQERAGPAVLLFQCQEPGAAVLKSSLERLLRQSQEEQRSQDSYSVSQPPRAESPCQPTEPSLPHGALDVLNHVLGDLELFVQQLRAAVGKASTKNLWKRKNKGKIFPPEAAYRDFFQKMKYAFNLLGKLRWSLERPSSAELLPSLFEALTFVLGHCPHGELAASVQSPLLIPAAVALLEATLRGQHRDTWHGLGPAWTKTRDEHPEGHRVPAYIPVFSDGWLPPRMLLPPGPPLPDERAPAPSHRDSPTQGPPVVPRELVRAQDEFQGRNAQELTVRRGDVLQVLDQRKRWWLVQNSHGDKGYVPSSILQPPGLGHRAQDTGVSGTAGPPQALGAPWTFLFPQGSPPVLHPGSPPAEVAAWLQDKGFSRLTVKCLGVLSGHQLLHMSPEELRAVCPEEWRRVAFKLAAVRTSLEMGPRD
ncbi:epidermal growth factor receptor kinase substrate 8-like protein 3 [Nothoprocta perdicaria]|uniref:epidermal growth factor receptor kinase substrate 8-like protein 3 n=1 Tax=Nothoprocta perdicaria TaxID=30464 RepID=UPI000E1B9DA7|nr:epidermal growth factor receptor kinase substrate 8-like protein 3 [Nothoprocta perdicaria]